MEHGFITVNNSLNGYSFGETSDGKPGYRKPGADTVTPFKTASYPSDVTLYSRASISIPVIGNTIAFKITTRHPYINFYIDGLIGASSTRLYTQLAGQSYNGSKNFDITNYDTIKFSTAEHSGYESVASITITNIEIN